MHQDRRHFLQTTCAAGARVAVLGMEPRLSPAEFSARIQQETRYWGPIAKASGFSSDS